MASTFKSICDAVKTALDAVTGMPTTVVRKRDVVLARDTYPLVVISFGNEALAGWATAGDGTNTNLGTIGKTYSVVVAIYRANVGDIAESDTNPNLILLAKQALNTGTLSGVTAVWSTELESHDEWESQPFKDAGEVSRFVVHYEAAESRIG